MDGRNDPTVTGHGFGWEVRLTMARSAVSTAGASLYPLLKELEKLRTVARASFQKTGEPGHRCLVASGALSIPLSAASPRTNLQTCMSQNIPLRCQYVFYAHRMHRYRIYIAV